MSKFTDQIMGKAEPDKIPLGVLVSQLCPDILSVLQQNGYKSVAFTLIVSDMESGDCAANGNLKPKGVVSLLEGALEQAKALVQPEGPPTVQ